MKTSGAVWFRFAERDGIEAAQKRVEVGAPESTKCRACVTYEGVDLPFSVLELASRAGLVRDNVDGTSVEVDGDCSVCLTADDYRNLQNPEEVLTAWVELQVAAHGAAVETAIRSLLAKPLETCVNKETFDVHVSVPVELAVSVRNDPRVLAREQEAKDLAVTLRSAAHDRQLDAYLRLDPRQAYTRYVRPGKATYIDFRRKGFNLLSDDELKQRFTEFDLAGEQMRHTAEIEIEQAKIQFRDFAVKIGGEAAAAVVHGYTANAFVLENIISQLVEAAGMRHAAVLTDGGVTFETRDSPRKEHIELEERLDSLIDNERLDKPDCMDVTVSSVSRIEFTDRDEFYRKLTGVVVTIESPITPDKFVVFSAE